MQCFNALCLYLTQLSNFRNKHKEKVRNKKTEEMPPVDQMAVKSSSLKLFDHLRKIQDTNDLRM